MIEMLNRKLPVASVRIVHVCVCMTVSIHSMVSAVERCVCRCFRACPCFQLFNWIPTITAMKYACLTVSLTNPETVCVCVCVCESVLAFMCDWILL